MKKVMLVIFVCSVIASTSFAQFNWNKKPMNLKVLPDTTSGETVRHIMIGFAQALGVRCSFCHDDSKGKEFSDIDFPSDAKPEKETAREMMKMMGAINNNFLSKLKKGDNDNVVQVKCITCHRGYHEPIELSALLTKTYQKSGLEASMERYNKLKEQYYGGYAFNFQQNSLDTFGKNLLDMGANNDALTVLKKNAELFPDWAGAYESLGDVNVKLGNKEEAIKDYKKAIQMNPRDRRVQDKLDNLE